MSDDIKPGDVVKLRSGGPAMTVQTVETEKETQWPIYCVWITDAGKMEWAYLAREAVIIRLKA